MAFDAGSIVGKLELGLESWKKSVEAVKADQQSMAGFATRHSEEIKKLGTGFAVAGAAMTAALTAVVLTTAAAGDEFDEMAAKTGFTTENLSTLKLAADKSGTSIDSVAAGMKFLAAQMIETASATDKSKTLLGALKIEATDTSGKLRPMNEVLFDVADKFKGMEAGALKTKLAVAIFGKAGMDMIPILDLGRDGLKANEDAARKLGNEWSGASAKAAAIFADHLVDLKAAGTGLSKTIGEMLMPTVQEIVEGMTKAISKVREWAEQNPELASTLASVGLALGGILTAVGGALLTIPTLMKSFTGLAGALHTTTAALGTSLVGLTVLVAAAVVAYNTINNLIKAKDSETEASYRAFEANQKLGQTLREIADKAGLTRAAFLELSAKYGDNYIALAQAIKTGKESVELQTAMTAVGKEHTKAVDAQTAASKKLDPALQAILDSLNESKGPTKTLAENLTELAKNTGVTWPEIHKLEKAITEAAKSGKILESDLKPARDRLAELKDQAIFGKKPLEDLTESMKNFVTETDKMAKPVEENALAFIDKLRDMPNEVDLAFLESEIMIQKIADKLKWEADQTKINNEKKSKSWADFNEQILANFITAVAGIITGQKTLTESFAAVGEAILSLWVNNMMNMAAESMKAGNSIGKSLATAMLDPISLITLAIGSLISAITGAAAKAKAWEDQVVNEMIKNFISSYAYLGTVSEATGRKIFELTNKIGQAAATATYLGDMMRDTGIDAHNFDNYLSMATNTLTLMEQGALDATTGTKAADEQFGLLLAAAKELGEEGSVAMVNFIRTSREMGLELASVTKYVDEQLGTVHAGAISAADGLLAMAQAVQPNADALDRLGQMALATFNAMIDNGATYDEAMASIGPTLDILAAKNAELGITAGPAIDQLLRVREISEAHKELFSAIDGNDAVLKALGNTGYMTADALSWVAKEAGSYYDQLIAAGMTSDEALRKMGPTLSDINKYAETYGITLDANTMALIDQAKEAGILKEEVDMGEEAQKTTEGIQEIAVTLEEVADRIVDAINRLAGFGTATDDVGGKVKDVRGGLEAWGGTIVDAGGELDDVVKIAKDVGGEIRGWDVALDFSSAFEKVKADAKDIGDTIGTWNDFSFPSIPQPGEPGETTPAQAGFAGRVTGPRMFYIEPGVTEDVNISRPGAGGGASAGGGGGSVVVNLNGPLVQSEGVSESDLERAGERLFAIIERETKRRGKR